MRADLTASELRYCETIRVKDAALRTYLASNIADQEPGALFTYLIDLKRILGNFNNDISFVAGLLAKSFIRERFGVDFDAAHKPQGASGFDVECVTNGGERIVGEIKTTTPYHPGFGANQRKEIQKDLLRLAGSPAEHRFMFVTDADSYRTLHRGAFSRCAPGVEIVNLVRGESFVCPGETEIRAGL
jgi:hypothetical protein